MGKRTAKCTMQAECLPSPQQPSLNLKKPSEFSISDKNYQQFFQFLKEIHGVQGGWRTNQPQFGASLSLIKTSIMNFFNFEKAYTPRQLQCSTICLANLFNVIGNDIGQLTFEKEFTVKLRRVALALAEDPSAVGFQQKVQALFYILVVLIYKERIADCKNIKQLNKRLFADRILVRALLQVTLPHERKIGKFYGIVMVFLSSRNNTHRVRQLLVQSVLVNFKAVEHLPTLLNLLVYLRSQKNKVSLNLRDVKEGRIFQLLVKAYPQHINDYQSFYILDYLQHLLMLFPCLAQQVSQEGFPGYLLQAAGPHNMHHPLHESTIIGFIQTTLKYLEPSARETVVSQIVQIQPPNHFLTIKLVQMLLDFDIEPTQLLQFVLKGYFDRLLHILQAQEDEPTKKRTLELYLKIYLKITKVNKALAELFFFKVRRTVEPLQQSQLLALLAEVQEQLQLDMI